MTFGLLGADLEQFLTVYQSSLSGSSTLIANDFDSAFGKGLSPGGTPPAIMTTNLATDVPAHQTPDDNTARSTCKQHFDSLDTTLKPTLVVATPSDPRLPEQELGHLRIEGCMKPVLVGVATPQQYRDRLAALLISKKACATLLRCEIKNNVVRYTPIWSKPFILLTVYPKDGLAAILSQIDDDSREYPVYFTSRASQGTEATLGA